MKFTKRATTAKIFSPPKCPIQLITKDGSNTLKIEQKALDCIKSFRETFGVVIVVGPYRQGKSFLLNQIMNKNGFSVGHKDESHTKGIWMWPELVKAKDEQGNSVNMLLLDTEVYFKS